MPRAPAIPQTDQAKADMLDNVALKLPGYATVLGLAPADVTSVANDAAMFKYIMDMQLAILLGLLSACDFP